LDAGLNWSDRSEFAPSSVDIFDDLWRAISQLAVTRLTVSASGGLHTVSDVLDVPSSHREIREEGDHFLFSSRDRLSIHHKRSTGCEHDHPSLSERRCFMST
jgi:hypothetical protein